LPFAAAAVVAVPPSSPAAVKVSVPELVMVAESEVLWTGVAVSRRGRVFVNYPRWSPAVAVSVAELTKSGEVRPFPDAEWNRWDPAASPADRFVCVQSVHIDRDDALWVLDPGMVAGKGVVEGGAKLLKVDLTSDKVVQTIRFDSSIAPQASYLNDVRVDTQRKYAYITDSGLGAIIAVNLATGESRRLLAEHPSTKSEDITLVIEGKPWLLPDGSPPRIHSDGVALDAKGEYLYYQALSGRTLYRIRTDLLRDPPAKDPDIAAAVEIVARPGPADGIGFGPDGCLYITSIEQNAIRCLTPEGKTEVLVQDDRLKWPDSLSITRDGTVYVTTSQIHLGAARNDPYRVFEVRPRASAKPPAPAAGTAPSKPAAVTPLPYEGLLKLFDYDRAAPTDLEVVRSNDLPGGEVVVQDVTYPSPVSGRVTALLVAPREPAGADTRRAGIVFLHWGQGDRTEFVWEAALFARAGAVSILLDAPWARPEPWRQPGEGHLARPDLVRGMYVQTILDIRRGIDVLLARGDVDKKRLAYVGHSFGATWGGTLAAVEKRFATHVLMGGLPRLTDFETKRTPKYEESAKHIEDQLTKEQFADYVAAIDPISSVHFIEHSTSRRRASRRRSPGTRHLTSSTAWRRSSTGERGSRRRSASGRSPHSLMNRCSGIEKPTTFPDCLLPRRGLFYAPSS
jgi:sugar lactone lactonase YvrE/dienelactone hydrolase